MSKTQAAAPYRHLSVRLGKFFLEIRSPERSRAERGDADMTFEQVMMLLSLIGGAIYVTFQITWTVSQRDKKSKKK